jgi:hypothetical protein
LVLYYLTWVHSGQFTMASTVTRVLQCGIVCSYCMMMYVSSVVEYRIFSYSFPNQFMYSNNERKRKWQSHHITQKAGTKRAAACKCVCVVTSFLN